MNTSPKDILIKLTKKIKLTDERISDNFLWSEFLRNQKEIPTIKILNNLRKVTEQLELYRRIYFHNSPIYITSGWRSVKYNAKIPGAAKKSTHTLGLAADFNVKGYTPQQVQKILHPVHTGGLEFAPTWTHIDLRGTYVRFTS